jgi:predicted RNA-binding protein YlqC (UPF0109 family)
LALPGDNPQGNNHGNERAGGADREVPEAVSVKEAKAERTTVLELRVAQEDLGKVIGKHGRTVIAIRTILIAAGKKIGRHFILEILE